MLSMSEPKKALASIQYTFVPDIFTPASTTKSGVAYLSSSQWNHKQNRDMKVDTLLPFSSVCPPQLKSSRPM